MRHVAALICMFGAAQVYASGVQAQTAQSDELSAQSGESLSKQLDRDKGVITPPDIGDTEIETTVPDPNPGTTKVIPPPGTPGGDQTIQPK